MSIDRKTPRLILSEAVGLCAAEDGLEKTCLWLAASLVAFSRFEGRNITEYEDEWGKLNITHYPDPLWTYHESSKQKNH